MNLRPSQVVLDPQNPRLPDGTSSDREAINRLLDDGPEQLINLARHLARTGEANPTELPIAVKQGKKYVILEGNRRFAALKLLNDPALANDETHQRAFRRAAGLGTPPKSIYCHVAASREEADSWIVLRHTGDNNGVGVKRWSASQTATHRRRNNATIDAGTARSITIADEVELAYATDETIPGLVQEVRKGKLTNIGRFFSLDVLAVLHLAIEVDESGESTLWARHTADQLRDFFAWAFEYILNNPVDAYKNADIRSRVLARAVHLRPDEADASEIAQRIVAVSNSEETLSQPKQADPAGLATGGGSAQGSSNQPVAGAASSAQTQGSSSGPEAQQSAGPQPAAKRSQAEAKPEPYLLHRLRLPNHPERVQRLLRECRAIDIETSPGTACVMIRVLVELSVSSSAALTLSGAAEGDSLKNKILSMLKFLDPDIENSRKRDKQLEQAFMEASDFGVNYMNGFLHNPSLYPDQHLARRFSQAFRPLLERVDMEL